MGWDGVECGGMGWDGVGWGELGWDKVCGETTGLNAVAFAVMQLEQKAGSRAVCSTESTASLDRRREGFERHTGRKYGMQGRKVGRMVCRAEGWDGWCRKGGKGGR